MPVNPKVNQMLKGVSDLEVRQMILNIFRYDSLSGRQIADAVEYERETGDVIGKNISMEPGFFKDFQSSYVISNLCPIFEKNWQEYSSKLPKEDRTYNLFLDKFSEYIVEQYKLGNLTDFDGIFEFIEACITNGEGNVQNAFVSNILENIQNLAGNQDINPEVFTKYLGSNSLIWWNEINRFWHDLEKYYKMKYPNQPG